MLEDVHKELTLEQTVVERMHNDQSKSRNCLWSTLLHNVEWPGVVARHLFLRILGVRNIEEPWKNLSMCYVQRSKEYLPLGHNAMATWLLLTSALMDA